MTWDERLDLIRSIIERARATGNTEALARAADLLRQLLELRAAEADVSQDGPDPMTRACTREAADRDSAAARKADGLHKLRKGRDSCGATRRDGEPCQAPAVEGTLVCRRHGGAAPQVQIKAKHTQLLAAAYFAHVEWQEARGTAAGFDALCKALQAQRDLDAYEARLDRLADLRAEIKRIRAERGRRTEEVPA